ncbi:MAG: FAD-binding oxidoreductase [Alphaproteobacteria bacterium]|nr:FAD-binding oxidoreductase [Alphaproteobacteria bacterium]
MPFAEMGHMGIERHKLRWNGWGWAEHRDPFSDQDEVWKWFATELGMPSLLATPARPLDDIGLPPSSLSAIDRHLLTVLLGNKAVRDDRFERAFHACGRSYADLLRLRTGDLSDAPDAVVYPGTSQDVLKVLAFASERSIAVVPFGGGTTMTGGITPRRNGHNAVLSLDLSAMEAVEIDRDSRTASIEAGIYGPALEAALAAEGMTLGHCPQSFEFSALGGWIATAGTGQQRLRYGDAEDWLLGANVATPRGMLHVSSGSAAANPQLRQLIAGSEGTLGVITRATVRVHPLPHVSTGRAYAFRDFESGAAALRDAARSGVGAAMLRLSDSDETRLCRELSEFEEPASLLEQGLSHLLRLWHYDEPCLLVAEFEGSRRSVAAARRALFGIARNHGALPLGPAPARRWQRNRFRAPYLRDAMLDRGLGVDTMEASTSWANLPNLYATLKSALTEAVAGTVPRPLAHGIILCHLTPAADSARVAFTYIFPRMLADEIGQSQAIRRAGLEAIAQNGGAPVRRDLDGHERLRLSRVEDGIAMEILRAAKNTLDPKGILNPGKLFPL